MKETKSESAVRRRTTLQLYFSFLSLKKTTQHCWKKQSKNSIFTSSGRSWTACLNMPDPKVCLEALEALTGCQMQPTTEDTQPTPQLTPQDLVNIVALREFYKQEGFKELEYESIGTLSLQDDADMYSSPPALCQAPESSLKPIVKINLQKFFHREFDYDFTNVKVSRRKSLFFKFSDWSCLHFMALCHTHVKQSRSEQDLFQSRKWLHNVWTRCHQNESALSKQMWFKQELGV